MLGGERELDRLLASMNPALDPARYVFCRRPDALLPPGVNALCMFRESEGVTFILEAAIADRLNFVADYAARRIVLTIHSDLGAVGFLARVSTALAEAGIPSNAVSAAYHDHLFVPEEEAERGLAVLRRLQALAAEGGTGDVLYCVTVQVDRDIADEWLAWMRTVHIPAVLRAGGFLGCLIALDVSPPDAGERVRFSLEYRAPSLEALHRYQSGAAPDLQQAHAERYADRFQASRAVRTVLAYPSPAR